MGSLPAWPRSSRCAARFWRASRAEVASFAAERSADSPARFSAAASSSMDLCIIKKCFSGNELRVLAIVAGNHRLLKHLNKSGMLGPELIQVHHRLIIISDITQSGECLSNEDRMPGKGRQCLRLHSIAASAG